MIYRKKIFLFFISCAVLFIIIPTALPSAASQESDNISFKERIAKILAEMPVRKSLPKKEVRPHVYNAAVDAAPSEKINIAETAFTFTEPLYVRPETNHVVIHHVGVPSGDVSASAIHQAHLANGWVGIGYHYVIRKNGTIERGRPLAVIGAHAYRHNTDAVGINVVGNFEWEVPTTEQIQSLEALLTEVCMIYHLDPEAGTTIEGHRDVNGTACPGKNLYYLLPSIRQAVKAKVADRLSEEKHGLTENKEDGNQVDEDASPLQR